MTIYSNCPIARRTMETFVQYVAVGGIRQRVEFQREIVWLVASSSQQQFIHGGQVLHEGSEFTDFYGYLNALNPEETVKLAKAYSITSASSLELRMQTSIKLVPHFETDECKEYNTSKPATYMNKWGYVPQEWRQETPDPDATDGRMNRSALEPIVLVESHTTWSSKRSEQENAAFIAQFINEWKRLLEEGKLATMQPSTALLPVPDWVPPNPLPADRAQNHPHLTERG